nr:MAG TPA: hypothetical protein [Caudoviricetes sp.]
MGQLDGVLYWMESSARLLLTLTHSVGCYE